MKNYLDEGHPTLMTVNKVATQRCCQLTSVDVVGELRGISEKDFLQIKSVLTLKYSKPQRTPRASHSPEERMGNTWTAPGL